jgi:signal transduction histidine kinase
VTLPDLNYSALNLFILQMPRLQPFATRENLNRFVSDADAALLLKKLGTTIMVVALGLMVLLAINKAGFRPAAFLAVCVGASILLLVRAGYVRTAGHALCWGLLLVGLLGIHRFGIRSTGTLVLPLAIMAGGWLLGRFTAAALAGVSSLMVSWVYWEQLNGVVRPVPPVIGGDVLSFVAIFAATAMLAAAMVATLRMQYTKVNALAGSLQEANATLEQRVAERSEQLADMQQKAMDTERLTSLGSMVAGISHELNTPLGNALTVSTTLEAQVRTLAQRVDHGKLTRTEMAEFLSGAAEMSMLATQSITRAANLVASFKQVAVDQTSEQRRTFFLDRVVADNVAALRPSFVPLHVNLTQDIPSGIRCDSYPGPLGQVLTNLMQNAVVHGFEGKVDGTVQITATMEADQVTLVVTDDGVGMEPKVLAHAFDPFFTTRLGKGGSGLGLSVSHRIATSVLGGSLSARSTSGSGSQFTLVFPLVAPAAIIGE